MRRAAAVALVAGLVLVGCGADDADEARPEPTAGVEGTVTVFAAASLTDVFEDLATAFEDANPAATVELGFGPSSGLVTQVIEGAPADVVATAATSNMDDLAAAGALDGQPTAIATNALAIAVPAGNPAGVTGLADVADEDLVVGLCNEEVPCGRVARQALDAAGIEPSIDTNEEDVRALVAKVEAGEVDVGVVYRTDVLAAGGAVDGVEIPDDQNVATTYPIAVVDEAANAAGARAFIDFVLSDEGQAALADAGFGPPG